MQHNTVQLTAVKKQRSLRWLSTELTAGSTVLPPKLCIGCDMNHRWMPDGGAIGTTKLSSLHPRELSTEGANGVYANAQH